MSQPRDDERWFNVLAGKAAATNADERQAASLRQYFELREQAEAQPDPAAMKRMENMLAARMASFHASQAVAASPAPQGLWQRFTGWLMPAGGHQPQRYALVAALALAVLAVPVGMRLFQAEDNGHLDMKQVKPGPGAENLVSTPQPEREARALLAVLQQNGLQATVVADGADQVVRSLIPKERLAEVGPALASMGLPAPVDGQLLVRFKKVP